MSTLGRMDKLSYERQNFPMIQILLSVSLALIALLLGWLECFRNGKPTPSGWAMILGIVTLTGVISASAVYDDRENSAKIRELDGKLTLQTEVAESLKTQNTALRVQVTELSAMTSDVRAIVLETLKVAGATAQETQGRLDLENAVLSLEVDRYYKVDTALRLYTGNGGVETLVLPGSQLMMLPETPFAVRNVRSVDGSIQYLVSFPMPRTNSDLGMGGWQSRYLLQSDLDGMAAIASNYYEYEQAGQQ